MRALDVSSLPAYSISNQSPLWWGQLVLAIIEGTMFSILIAMYFYIRMSVDVWPPPGTQLPHTTLSTVNLVLLILSAAPAYWAGEAAKKNDRRGMLLGMGLNLLLAILFIVLRIVEWHSFNFNWATDVHGSIVWTIMGLHTFDLVGDAGFTLVLFVIVLSGKYAEKERLGVYVDTVVWFFLVGIWIPLYVVVYWGPQLVGGYS